MINRLEEIRALFADWHHDAIGKISEKTIDFVKSVLIDVMSKNIDVPSIFPMLNCGVSIEWTIGDWEISVDFNDELTMFFALNTNTDEDICTYLENPSISDVSDEIIKFFASVT